jgi:hypothetical protein
VEIVIFRSSLDLKDIRRVFEGLREKVDSPPSYTSTAEEGGISPNTVKKYREIFEALYMVFRVTSFSLNMARNLLKEQKKYLFNKGLVKGDGGDKL